MDSLLLGTITVSLVLQVVAAAQALHLIRLTGRFRAWIFVVVALSCMAVRRVLVLTSLLFAPDATEQVSLVEELVALATSAFMMLGIFFIGPLFRSIQRSQQALRDSEANYRAVVENANEGIFIVADGRFRFHNAATCQITGYDQRELGEMAADDLFAERDRETFARICARVLAGQPVPHGQRLPARAKNDRALFLALNVAPISWHGRSAVLVMARDLTESKKLEERLVHAQKMEALGRLAGGVAHEFNNMLTVINCYNELALRMVNGHAALRAKLEAIEMASQRSKVLTRQLLDFSRAQPTEISRLDLNGIIMNLAAILAPLLGERIRLATDLGAELWPIIGERGQIEQVVMNLILNARDAISGNGRISVETRNQTLAEEEWGQTSELAPGDYVLLTVADSGCGMDQTLISHIFEPFFTTKEVGKGTGLGLSTVYGIVKGLGGHVSCCSEPGLGSTFKIRLPVYQHEASPLAGVSVGQAELPGGGVTVFFAGR